ncbi:MAG: VOC family protein [Cyclobacteriaceae bacterium]|nr:VOC family protein [Cyclobacteriaceae bacterium]
MDAQSNNINWFEIPVADMDRARKFYETIFDFIMETQDLGNFQLAFFPGGMTSPHATGALAQSAAHKPSPDGTIVYLNANPALDDVIGRVEAAGGKVVVPKTQITEEIGFMAFFEDTEGNRVALHSQN